MDRRSAGGAACAVVAGILALSGCAAAPEKSATAPAMMDISQVPGLRSRLYIAESASVRFAPAPSAEDLALAAMQKQTGGMTPGAVAGGPKEQVVIRIPETVAPEAGGAKPVVTIPALQSGAGSLSPEEAESWKKPLPPLKSLEGK